MEIKGRAALIAGGARIGAAVAGALARRGCDLALAYRRSRESAEAAARDARSRGVKAVALRADLTSERDVARLFSRAEKELGRLDILVNLASLYRPTPFQGLKASGQARDPWRESLDTDLRAAYWLSLKAAALMRRRGAGRMVHFTDWVAASGRPRYKDHLPYYVAKAGIKGLVESLALELAPEVLVNAVAPGPILAPPDLGRAEEQEVLKNTPLRRWGGAGEIAKAVLFLIETDFVTGECLRVDGGRHLF